MNRKKLKRWNCGMPPQRCLQSHILGGLQASCRGICETEKHITITIYNHNLQSQPQHQKSLTMRKRSVSCLYEFELWSTGLPFYYGTPEYTRLSTVLIAVLTKQENDIWNVDEDIAWGFSQNFAKQQTCRTQNFRRTSAFRGNRVIGLSNPCFRGFGLLKAKLLACESPKFNNSPAVPRTEILISNSTWDAQSSPHA